MTLSPLSQRLIALALLALAVIMALNLVALPLIAATNDAVARLHDARFRLHRLEGLAARPALPSGDRVPPDCCIVAGTRAAAEALLRTRIVGAAAAQQVMLGQVTLVPGDGTGALAIDITASAHELAVIHFVGALEQGTPWLRLARWKLIAPAASGSPVQLEARVAAVWYTR